MKGSQEETAQIKAAKVELGKLIRELHDSPEGKTLSLRKAAKAVGVSAPNMTQIENGVYTPSPDVYDAIIKFFKPAGCVLSS